MTISQTKRMVSDALTPAVGAGEARAMSSIIIEEVKGYTPTQMLINSERELLPETVERIRKIVGKVIAGEPLQYVLGVADFRGRRFSVTPATLIPRPETSQLVDMIVDQYAGYKDLRILDIGTGSGCIAISLSLDLAYAEVDAIDISADALTVAAENARRLRAHISTYNLDAMTLGSSGLSGHRYDIIVSNPPYVLKSERASMDRRVTDHEPSTALFVSDDAPVAIYQAIADYGVHNLNNGGRLYLEINPLCADSIDGMLRHAGYTDVQVTADYRGQKRFAIATLEQR